MDGNNRQFEQQVPPQGQPANTYYQQPQPQYGQYTQQGQPQGQYYQQPQPQYYQQVPGLGFDPFALQGYYPQPAPFDEKGAKKHFSGIGLSYFLFSIVAGVVQIIAAVVINLVNPLILDNYLFSMLVALLPMYCFGAPVCIILMKKLPAEKPERAPWGFGRFIGGLVIALSLMYIGSFIGTYIGLLIESFAPEATASTNAVQEMVYSGNMMINVIFMVFVGPVVEELLFRKLLCDRLRIYGEGITVVVTAILFGLFHGNLTQFVYAFLLGGLLAYIYLKTGRVTVTIAYHIVLNFIGSVVPLLALKATDIDGMQEILSSGDTDLVTQFVSDNIESFAIYALYAFSIIIFMMVGLILLIVLAACGKIKFRPGRYKIPSGKRFAVVILNVGMILFILSEIGEILVNMFA